MLRRVFYQFKHFKKKYSYYQLIKKIGKKLYKRLYHSINSKIMIINKAPIDLPNEYFSHFIPFDKFFFEVKNKDKYNSFLECYKLKDEVITQADEICQHWFDLLGSAKVFLGAKINWHKDFKSDFIWPRNYFYKVATVDLTNNADVKVPWELSRFQHLPTLGQAYWLTDNPKYALEFMEEIEDWIKQNPVAIGVNWACTMDVAIRAVNWIIGFYYFRNSEILKESFWMDFFKNLYLTGRFIAKNLENDVDGHGNNHYMSDLVGLVWIGVFFNNFNKRTRAWFNKGIEGIKRELKYQVYPEGTDFEASIPYHRLVTEMLLSTTILAERSNIKFEKTYIETLEKMCEFVMYYTKHNGLAPQVGDADDGRLHILTHYGVEEKRDHRHILGLAGEYFNRDDFRYFAGNERMDAIWLIGGYIDYTYKPRNVLITKSYNEMGYFIIRDKRIYMIIRCGGVGQAGIGGHSHNDQLSIELQIDGKDVFVDSGTFVYASDYVERNHFRGTAYHNTLQVQEEEQNPIDDKQLFRLFDHTKSRLVRFEQTLNEVIFIGEHQGYMDRFNIVHRREIIYDFIENKIVIKDSIGKPVQCRVNWNLDSNVEYMQLDATNLILDNKVKVNFNNDICITDSYLSPSYGEKIKNKKITVYACEHNETFLKF